jgi:hypothetical protein
LCRGIGIDGTKCPLSPVEGSTENTTLVTDLIVGLRERGLETTRPILVVIESPRRGARRVRPPSARVRSSRERVATVWPSLLTRSRSTSPAQ